MRTLLSIAAIVAVLALTAQPVAAGKNGGTKCASCTILVSFIAQTMKLKNLNATPAAELFCSYMPYPFAGLCMDGVKPYVDSALLDQGEGPDAVCAALKDCFVQDATCKLYSGSQYTIPSDVTYAAHIAKLQAANPNLKSSGLDICDYLPGICAIVNHKPYFDNDGDLFSTHNRLRGAYFRGRDCDDHDAKVFPGVQSSDPSVDSNCNGIYGTDPTSGSTYEDQWCEGTNAIGVASLGDSATAHFRLPRSYFNVSMHSAATFANLFRTLEDEADWPMLSWSTGFLNASEFSPDIQGPMTSLYSRLVEHNRCNHRDYQNIGVNGGNVDNLLPFEADLARNRSAGIPLKPLILIMSMVGNDVCDHHHGEQDMTTAAEYLRRITRAVTQADAMLPPGSHVILVPLVDGRILYDNMHSRTHPLGATFNDLTYTELYDFLNCLDISPCWGWMNSNATVRNMTTARADLLNAQLPTVVQQSANLTNIQVHFFGNTFMTALESYSGPHWELIEPVDGFHPSQLANSFIGDLLFQTVKAAGILGPENPNNAAITAKFGDQGGY